MKFSHFKRNTTSICAATALLLMAAFPASRAIAKTVGVNADRILTRLSVFRRSKSDPPGSC
ncbi:hypothetical protein PP727_22945, partial [Ralstonia solanacearum]|nr:hypothetical protein [Ralstonia solanacearum]MDC6213018.1 hypothetical protein [Ralstonia solanacearum]MDC6241927.1 hypothetical protein [Ralstonia solanacearum]MDD7803631.1 hypothetical protein [Ralstonia solanacearum]